MVEPKARGLQPFKMSKSTGINNVIKAEKCKPEELQTATDVDINDSRQIIRRQGMDKVYSGSVHSLASDGTFGSATFMVFREGANLNRLNSDYSASLLRNGLTRAKWMKYLSLNNLLYYTDESVTGITDGVTSRSWGLTVPTQPTLAQTTGNLFSGRYLCSLTYVRNDGQESGAPRAVYIDLTSNNSGITISGIPTSSDATVSSVNVYLSTRNGEVLYLAKTVANGTGSTTYSGDTKEFSLELATLMKGPPHAGHMIQFYNGRIYIAKDNGVWYTEPYNYELMNLAHGFIPFPDRVTLFAPVKGGIWASYKKGKTFFLQGDDPAKFVTDWKKEIAAYEGSQVQDDIRIKGETVGGWYWMAYDGIYIGLDGGNLLNITYNRYRVGSGTSNICVSTIKRTEDKSKQYVSVLY